jgi:MFS family permease
VLAVAPDLIVALVGAALAGIANGVLSTAFMTETQDRTPKDWMALVTTLLQSIRQISPGIGILIGGVLASAGSSRLAFAVAGVGCLLFAVATFVLLSPGRRVAGAAHRALPLSADDIGAPVGQATIEAPAAVPGPDGMHSPSSIGG